MYRVLVNGEKVIETDNDVIAATTFKTSLEQVLSLDGKVELLNFTDNKHIIVTKAIEDIAPF